MEGPLLLAGEESRLTAPARTRTVHAQVLALIDQGWVSASTFATTALIARMAGLDALGTFTIVWMIVLLVNAAQNAVVIAPMTSLTPSDPAEASAFYGHYVRAEGRFIAWLGSASCVLIAVTSAVWPAGVLLVGCALAMVIVYQAYDFVRRLSHALGRHLAAVVVSAVIAVAQVGTVIAVGRTRALDAPMALAVIATSMAIVTVTAAPFILRRFIGQPENEQLAGRSWASSRWLLGSAAMQWTCGNLFVLLAPAFVGLGAAGALRAAQSIVGVTNIWQQGLENVVPLHAGRLWRGEGPMQAVRYVGRVSLAWTFITGMFVTAVVMYAGPLLSRVYGAEVAEYAWVLQWYAALQLLIFLGLPLRSLLRAAERTRGIFLAFAAAAVFSVAAVVPLLHAYGLAGALAGLTGAQIVFQCVLALSIWSQFRTTGLTLTTTHP